MALVSLYSSLLEPNILYIYVKWFSVCPPESTDDDKIVKFHWEKTSGPLNSKSLDDTTTDQAMLIVKDLVAGKYTFRLVKNFLYIIKLWCIVMASKYLSVVFRLTVTDSDGTENSTIANVTVIKGLLNIKLQFKNKILSFFACIWFAFVFRNGLSSQSKCRIKCSAKSTAEFCDVIW